MMIEPMSEDARNSSAGHAVPSVASSRVRKLLAKLCQPSTLVGVVSMVDGGFGFALLDTHGDGIVIRGQGLAVYHMSTGMLDKLVSEGRLRRADHTGSEGFKL